MRIYLFGLGIHAPYHLGNEHNKAHEAAYGLDSQASAGDWSKQMEAFWKKKFPNGPQGTTLEIHCHGYPGELLLGPTVSFNNLQTFAALVRKLIKPNGFIEILACDVANFSATALAERGTRHNFDVTQWAQMDAFDREKNIHSGKVRGTQDFTLETQFSSKQVVSLVQKLLDSDEEALASTEYRAAFKDPFRNRHLPKDDGSPAFVPPAVYPAAWTKRKSTNGPLYCSRLAKATKCTVRAAILNQAEEGDNGQTIGDWEGHVLDFLPTGKIRYAGFCLKRPTKLVRRPGSKPDERLFDNVYPEPR
jgi:hypothetical protein